MFNKNHNSFCGGFGTKWPKSHSPDLFSATLASLRDRSTLEKSMWAVKLKKKKPDWLFDLLPSEGFTKWSYTIQNSLGSYTNNSLKQKNTCFKAVHASFKGFIAIPHVFKTKIVLLLKTFLLLINWGWRTLRWNCSNRDRLLKNIMTSI